MRLLADGVDRMEPDHILAALEAARRATLQQMSIESNARRRLQFQAPPQPDDSIGWGCLTISSDEESTEWPSQLSSSTSSSISLPNTTYESFGSCSSSSSALSVQTILLPDLPHNIMYEHGCGLNSSSASSFELHSPPFRRPNIPQIASPTSTPLRDLGQSPILADGGEIDIDMPITSTPKGYKF